MKILPLPALAFLVMALIGWNLGGNPAQTATSTTPPPSRPSRPERQTREAAGPRGEAARRMDHLRQIRHPEERMRATMDLAASISPADFAAWIEGGWFSLRHGMDLTLFTQILMERWRNEDPEGLLLWSDGRSSPVADSLLLSWSQHEPQRLLDFFRQHPDMNRELDTLPYIAGNHPSLALQRLLEMISTAMPDIESCIPSHLLKELAKHSPAALEAALDSFPAPMRKESEKLLLAGKLEASFSSEMRKLWDRADGFELFDSIFRNSDFARLNARLFEEFANFPDSWRKSIHENPDRYIDRSNAAQWLAQDLVSLGFPEEMEKTIHAEAILALSQDQPADALAFLMTSGLDRVARETMLFQLFERAAGNPQQAEAMLASLTSEEDREVARKSMAPRESTPPLPEIENPSDWLAAITAPDTNPGESYDYLSMIDDWAPEKLTALKNQFNALPDDKQYKLIQTILRSGEESGPLGAEALAALIRHPWDATPLVYSAPFSEQFHGNSEEMKAGLASRYVANLAGQDPAAAGEWIAALPEGQPKLWAQKNLHSHWSQYDPEAAGRWMASLPAATQAQVRELHRQREEMAPAR